MATRFSLHGSIRNISHGVQRARRAEELGYEAIFIADAQMTCLDPFQTLAVCAGHTKRLRLATAVTNMVYRDPTVLAGSAATLNEISEGRAILGLGTGDGPVYTLGRKATPMAKFEAGLKAMRELLQGKPAEFPSGKVGLKAGKLPVPVYVSVEGPRGLQVAGRVADGVILGNGFDLRVLQWAKEKIATGAREVGRSPSEIDILVAGMICVDKDGDRARATVRSRLANRAHHNFRFTLETVPPKELDGVKRFMEAFDMSKPLEEKVDPSLVTDYMARRFSIAGTPDECAARIKELEQAGVNRVLLTPPEKIWGEMVEAWAKEVMPRV
ncbi:MAG: LLM class flavin-dependent oxidoreductase [Deltaproteobacteria bacterium]|nr:LLM class flavin-dependent oxidoreductase [Deltaproteobacteria bacterium]